MNVPAQEPDQVFFAACPRNVSALLAAELQVLGAKALREHPAGVGFQGPRSLAYLACLHLRTSSRVLLEVGDVPAANADEFYERLKALEWERHLAAEGTLAVDVVGDAPDWLHHPRFAAQRAKDAIVDRYREQVGSRPSVDLENPDLRVNVRLARGRATISIDLSGEPLHRRGYRQSGGDAPLKENLAAALLLRCGWPEVAAQGGALVDPMCGSGTLVIEAALIAANIAPGLLRRRFGFEKWLGHDVAEWQRVRGSALDSRDLAVLGRDRLRGYDQNQSAVRAAIANANRAGLGEHLVFERRAIGNLPRSGHTRGLVIVNPPYGGRMGEESSLRPLYAQLGERLLECFSGWEGAVFTGNPPLGRALGLRAYRSHAFFNGSIECKLLRFRLDESGIEPDRETARNLRLEKARARPGADMFANRLRKNHARLKSWALREDVSCFRVYDADMPEYAFAIDIYGNGSRHACVQEYAAPVTVAPEAARARRDEAMSVLPEVLELPPERIHFRQRRRQKGGTQYEKLGEQGEFVEIREGRYRFIVNFSDYLDTGLFLDHRLTRKYIGSAAPGRRFLNLFAYTGSATVYAAGGGATGSTSVDMSHTYLDWAKRNLTLNDLAGPDHVFVRADCLAWLEGGAIDTLGRYGLIFADPPTVSRSKRMQRDFDVQRDHAWLLQQAGRLLEPEGVIVFSTNYRRFKLDGGALAEYAIEDITRQTIPEDFRRNQKIHACFALRKRVS